MASLLKTGTLTTSAATVLYTVPSSTQTYVTSIKATNVGGSTRTFTIYVKESGGTARAYSQKTQSIAASGSAGSSIQVVDDAQGLRLPVGAAICGDASANTDIEYVISGIESAA